MIDGEPTRQEVDAVIAGFEKDITRDEERQRRLMTLKRFTLTACSPYNVASRSVLERLNNPDQA